MKPFKRLDRLAVDTGPHVAAGPAAGVTAELQSDTAPLLSIYAIERQSDENAFSVAFAITTAGLTYVLAVTAYMSDRCTVRGCGTLSPNIQVFVPAITYAFTSALMINLATSRLRSAHLLRLEELIQRRLPSALVGFDLYHTDARVMYRRGTRGHRAPRMVFPIVNNVSYAVIFVTLFGFSAFVLAFGPFDLRKIVASVLYGVLLVFQVAAYALSNWHPMFAWKPRIQQPIAPGIGGDRTGGDVRGATEVDDRTIELRSPSTSGKNAAVGSGWPAVNAGGQDQSAGQDPKTMGRLESDLHQPRAER